MQGFVILPLFLLLFSFLFLFLALLLFSVSATDLTLLARCQQRCPVRPNLNTSYTLSVQQRNATQVTHQHHLNSHASVSVCARACVCVCVLRYLQYFTCTSSSLTATIASFYSPLLASRYFLCTYVLYCTVLMYICDHLLALMLRRA